MNTHPRPPAVYIARIVLSLEQGTGGFAYAGDLSADGVAHNAYCGFSGKAGARYDGWSLQFEYDTRAFAGSRVLNPRIVTSREAVLSLPRRAPRRNPRMDRRPCYLPGRLLRMLRRLGAEPAHADPPPWRVFFLQKSF